MYKLITKHFIILTYRIYNRIDGLMIVTSYILSVLTNFAVNFDNSYHLLRNNDGYGGIRTEDLTSTANELKILAN